MKVLNFGSLNIDYVYKLDHIVRKGETISSESLNLYPGGKGLNQSIALGRAGVTVYHAGCIGPDGRFLKDILKESGVNTDFISETPDVRTGNAIIQNDASGDNCIILYGGANHAISRDQIDRVLKGFSEGDFIILQNEISELPYIIAEAKEKGMVVVLNPSPMNQVIEELPFDSIDYLLLNELEAEELVSGGSDDVEKLQTVFPDAKIILTLGENGSVYFDHGDRYSQSVYHVDVVDTTAAGDTFTGYFLAGVLDNFSIASALEYAAAAAAIAVSNAGAATSIPYKKDVEEFLRNRKNRP